MKSYFILNFLSLFRVFSTDYSIFNFTNMKQIFSIVSASFIAFSTLAQGIKMPAPSPSQTIKQDFALSHIEVSYSRPVMKGRVIFGDLVPFGKVWRTGANNATRITFGEDVKVGGVAVKAGSYALYTIPDKTEWEVILNKSTQNWGSNGYDKADDVARFKVKPMALAQSVESFTIQLADVVNNKANVQIMWEKTGVSFPVEADIDTKIMAQINTAMNVDSKPYFQAASYYFEAGKDLKQAATWAAKAVEAQPKAYWVVLLQARILAQMGDKKGALEASNRSLALAKEAGNEDYVALNQKLQATLK